MKSTPVLTGIAVVLLAMVGAVIYKEMVGEKAGGGSSGARAVPVQTAEIESHPFSDTVEAIGTVRAEESVAVTTNVADTVTSIEFTSGQMVEAGQVLLTLADAEERAALAEAEAALADAQRDSERLEELSRNNAIAASELDQSRSTVQRSLAQVDMVQARLDDHIIRAPFSGRIGLRDVSSGAYVTPGDVLLTLDQLDEVDLDFTVPERFLAVLEPELRVSAIATAYPDEEFDGTITDIDSRVDPITRAVTIRARLPNSDGRLRPGMLLAVEVRRDERESPAVPEVAVMRNGEQVFVFGVVDSDEGSRAVQLPVKLGSRDGSMIEVLEGVQTGDIIISEGMHRATDEALLEIKGTLADEKANKNKTGDDASVEVQSGANES